MFTAFLTFFLTYFLTIFLTYFLTFCLTFFLSVEVWQGTLDADGRRWGPSGNTGLKWSWLRSGREHWTWLLAVEARGWREEEDEEDEEDEEEQAEEEEAEEDEEDEEEQAEEEAEEEQADIKSNNPHLTGGKRPKTPLSKAKMIAVWLNEATPKTKGCATEANALHLQKREENGAFATACSTSDSRTSVRGRSWVKLMAFEPSQRPRTLNRRILRAQVPIQQFLKLSWGRSPAYSNWPKQLAWPQGAIEIHTAPTIEPKG